MLPSPFQRAPAWPSPDRRGPTGALVALLVAATLPFTSAAPRQPRAGGDREDLRNSPPAASVATPLEGEVPPEDLVFVTEDLADFTDGCDAISILSSRTGEAVVRGTTIISPGRIALSPDLSLAIAPASNEHSFLYLLRRSASEPSRWESSELKGARIPFLSGAAVLGDGDTILVATEASATETDDPAPFRIGKYRLADVLADQLGPPRAIDGAPVRILLAGPDEAHVVTDHPRVYTISTSQMTNTVAPVELQPYAVTPDLAITRRSVGHAAMTADGAFLVTNRYEVPELNVVDLVARRASTLAVPDVSHTGGVAINRGWINTGLLALHARSEVVVYAFDPPSGLTELSRVPVPEPDPLLPEPCEDAEAEICSGPFLSIAWSGSGSHLIAAGADGTADFVVIAVNEGGRSLEVERALTACPLHGHYPNDIVTINGMAGPFPTATAGAPTPTAFPTASATVTATETVTSTATPTATGTETATETSTPTSAPTLTAPATPTPTETAIRTETATATPNPTAAPTETATATAIPTLAPTQTATSTTPPTLAATPTPGSTVAPTWTPATAPATTPTPSASPTRLPPAALYLPIALKELCPPADLYIDVALVVDASTSMLEPSGSGRTKIAAAIESVRRFAERLRLGPDADRAALVTFNVSATRLQPLTSDRGALSAALERIEIARGSRVDLGIEAAREELARAPAAGSAERVRAILLLSDGIVNPVGPAEVLLAADRAKREGIALYVVGLGPNAVHALLREIASGSDRYFAAPDPERLEAVYIDLARRIPCPPERYWPRRPSASGATAPAATMLAKDPAVIRRPHVQR